MQFIKKLNIVLIILFTFITFAQAETSWITKKKDKDKTEKVTKVVEKKSSEWIKKKEVNENKKKYKSDEKKITKEVKSWITKKSKDKYIKGIENLPDAAIYFTASNEDKSLLVYGYVLIRQKKRQLHKNVMLTSFGTSAAFLVSYVIYHWFKSGPKEYLGDYSELYFFILITHIVLAAIIVPLALITFLLLID